MFKKYKSFTLIEMVISIFLSSIIAMTGYSVYFYINMIVNKRIDNIYLNEMALNTFSFISRDFFNAGYKDYNSVNGDILNPIVIQNNSLTITYDINATNRVTNTYSYDQNTSTLLLNNLPLSTNITLFNVNFDTNSTNRYIINLQLTGTNTYNDVNLTKNYRKVLVKRN